MRAAGLGLLVLCACGGAAPAPPALDLAQMEPRVAQALEAAREAVVAERRSAGAWRTLGYVLDAHQLYEQAEVCLDAALELDGSDFKAAYAHAFLGGLLGRSTEEVVGRYERARALDASYPALHLRLAEALDRAGDEGRAVAAYRAALALEPGYHRAGSGLGALLVRRGELEEAAGLLEAAHAVAPDDQPTAAALAQLYGTQGRAAEAAELAAAASVLEGPTLPLNDTLRREVLQLSVGSWVSSQRAQSLLAARRYEEAYAELHAVIDQRPEAYNVRLLLARACLALGRLQEARGHLSQVLAEAPGLPLAAELVAQLDVQEGSFAEGLARFEELARVQRLGSASFIAWGVALARLERYGEAAARFATALEEEPRNADCRYRRALALELAGETAEALEEYARAHEELPGHPLAERFFALRARHPGR